MFNHQFHTTKTRALLFILYNVYYTIVNITLITTYVFTRGGISTQVFAN